jgi:uncharacterized membrane protein YwaF
VFDWITGANYMYLATAPRHASLLSLFGPWPWYIVSAAVVAFALLLVLDAPFRRGRAAPEAGVMDARPAYAQR